MLPSTRGDDRVEGRIAKWEALRSCLDRSDRRHPSGPSSQAPDLRGGWIDSHDRDGSSRGDPLVDPAPAAADIKDAPSAYMRQEHRNDNRREGRCDRRLIGECLGRGERSATHSVGDSLPRSFRRRGDLRDPDGHSDIVRLLAGRTHVRRSGDLGCTRELGLNEGETRTVSGVFPACHSRERIGDNRRVALLGASLRVTISRRSNQSRISSCSSGAALCGGSPPTPL